jgi:hypothetical protein
MKPTTNLMLTTTGNQRTRFSVGATSTHFSLIASSSIKEAKKKETTFSEKIQMT